MGKKKSDSFYALRLFDLSDEERERLISILNRARALRVIDQSELESRARSKLKKETFSLRHALGPRRESTLARSKRVSSSGGYKPTFSQEKWIFLYEFVMSDLRKKCVARKIAPLIEEIGELYRLGIESGRYDNDTGLLRSAGRFPDARIDEKYRNSAYAGFRLSSSLGTTKSPLIVSLCQFGQLRERDMFRSVSVTGSPIRRSSGLCYEMGGTVLMFGALEDDAGTEHFALRPSDDDGDFLFGIVTTVNNSGEPFAKQCFFVRARLLEGVGLERPNLHEPESLEMFRSRVGEFVTSLGDRILLMDQDPILTSRYLANDFLRARNVKENTIKLTSQTH